MGRSLPIVQSSSAAAARCVPQMHRPRKSSWQERVAAEVAACPGFAVGSAGASGASHPPPAAAAVPVPPPPPRAHAPAPALLPSPPRCRSNVTLGPALSSVGLTLVAQPTLVPFKVCADPPPLHAPSRARALADAADLALGIPPPHPHTHTHLQPPPPPLRPMQNGVALMLPPPPSPPSPRPPPRPMPPTDSPDLGNVHSESHPSGSTIERCAARHCTALPCLPSTGEHLHLQAGHST